VFEERVMQGHWVTPAAIVMPSSEAVRDYVAEHEGAIGYLSMGIVDSSVKVVAVDGIVPTRETVGRGLYSLVRPMLLVTNPSVAREVRAFVDWIQGSGGQAIVVREYAAASAR
jgi:phosphate transport system substrate-binding protein